MNPFFTVCSALLSSLVETELIQVCSFENKGADANGDASSLQILIWAWPTELSNFLTRDAAAALHWCTWGTDVKLVGIGGRIY